MMRGLLNTLWLVLYIFQANPVSGVGEGCDKTKTPERCLINKLLEGYNPAVRPVQNVTAKITIKLHMRTLTIVELNEKEQILETSGWLVNKWTDFQLKWNPEEYGNLVMVRLPIDKIWMPDIVVTNSVDNSNIFSSAHVRLAIVMHEGTVVFTPHMRLRTDCKLSMARFPHDSQTCRLILGSWTHDLSKLDLQLLYPNSSQATYQVEAKEWEVQSVDRKRNKIVYGKKDSQKAAIIIFTYNLVRSSTYLQQMFTLPPLALALITVCQFLIPPMSSERIIIGVGSIISEILLIILLEGYMPREMSDIPTPALYLFFLLVMSGAGVFISATVLNVYHRDVRKGKVPAFIRKMFLQHLRGMLCMSADYLAVPGEDPAFDNRRNSIDIYNQREALAQNADQNVATVKVLEDIRDYLKLCATKRDEPVLTHRQIVINEWKQLAYVLDRAAFFIYAITILVATIVIYIR